MRIVFHGAVAASYVDGFAALLDGPHDIATLPDELGPADARTYDAADMVISHTLDRSLAGSPALKLFHAPSSGIDRIDPGLLPPGVPLCNCAGHEAPIAEYVVAALLWRHVPLVRSDAALRRGAWPGYSGMPARTELGGTTVGLLGFGGIGRAVAARLRPFGMRIHAANRGLVADGLVDRYYPLSDLHAFLRSADAVVCSLPASPGTVGLLDRAALQAMRSDAVLVNVGRGAVIDEGALFEALQDRRIASAVIDTWYSYPKAGPKDAISLPSRYPFHELDNVLMTPHMSGWTVGTRARRQSTMANNARALARGDRLTNEVPRDTVRPR